MRIKTNIAVNYWENQPKLTENKNIQLRNGLVYKRKPAYIVFDERNRAILSQYSKDTFDQFYSNSNLNLNLIVKY